MRPVFVLLACGIIAACTINAGEIVKPTGALTPERPTPMPATIVWRPFSDAMVDTLPIVDLARVQLWDWKDTTLFDVPPLDLDSLGVPFITWGGPHSRQPVSIATVAILMLSNAQVTGNRSTRDTVELWAHRLIAETETATRISFPYEFDFALHGIPADNQLSPWYSALAEGEWLELLVRLYQVTGKPEYKASADKIFPQFLDTRPSTMNTFAIAHVDSAGYYWADEYPNSDRPDLTLNGYMYAIRGVYEYWQLTKDPDAERVLHASFATVKHYWPQFRNVGGISKYCLRHPWVTDGTYHKQIVGLFRDFARMSGDPAFTVAADALQSDYWQ